MDPSSTDMGMEVCSSVLVELFFSLLGESSALGCFFGTRLKMAKSA